MNVTDSFDPVFSDDLEYSPRVMILGSSPGKVSLQQQKYYAHPRNSFWWIMSQLLPFSIDDDYQRNIDALIQSGIFLWDVLKRCERQGSLDANILRQSEEVNDIELILRNYNTISAIFFNGKVAHSIFNRHFNTNNFEQVKYYVLPSTSPAHASISREEKLQHWRVISDYLK